MVFKIFDLYDVEEVKVSDQALAPYINLEPKLLVKSHGRNVGKFTQSKVHIIERLANRLAVPGHVGKKHKIITSQSTGKYTTNMATVLRALKIIAEKKKVNPLQILVQAIENGSPRDEITTIEYGGARYPQAVDVSPLRRVNLAIRWMVQGSHQKSFGKKETMVDMLTNEIIAAYNNDASKSDGIRERERSEKEAEGAR